MVQLLMPVLPFCAVLISSAAAWLWSRFMSVRSVHGLHLPFMCEDAARVRAHMLSGLSLALPFMHIVYNSICVTVFHTFQCFLLPDGKYRLTAAPDVVCWEEGEHQAMVAASILAILVYIIGVPAYVLVLILFAKRHDKLKDPEWLKCFGFLYVRYGTAPRAFVDASVVFLALVHKLQGLLGAEPEFFFWEVAFLLRRLAFCMALVALQNAPMYQGVLSMLASVGMQLFPPTAVAVADIAVLAGRCDCCHSCVEHRSIRLSVRLLTAVRTSAREMLQFASEVCATHSAPQSCEWQAILGRTDG